MFPTLTLNTGRAAAIEAFRHLHLQATFGILWGARRTGARRLKDFGASACPRLESRRFLGLRDVPVERITGSLGRGSDFDPAFRPLKKHLRDRWVSVYLLASAWEPLRLHKVGEDYYVEDGHHRVSVARERGMACLQAEVWEYRLQPCRLAIRPHRSPQPRPRWFEHTRTACDSLSPGCG
jgi:hypothetical protein